MHNVSVVLRDMVPFIGYLNVRLIPRDDIYIN
jgi:hypothetical protein